LQKFGIINFISIIKNILIFEKNKMNFRQNALNRQKKPSKNYIFYILVIVIILWFSVKYKYDNFPTETEIKESRSIIIKKWDTFSALGEKIPEFNSIFYKLYIRFNPPNFELKEWSYKIEKWKNIIETIESLKKTAPLTNNVTILEWWNIYDIDKTLASKWLISEWEYINYVTSSEKIAALKQFFPFLDLNLESLEGYLYPDTYSVDSATFKINNFVIMQLEEFEKKVYEKLFKDKHDNKTIYDVINLASIVEKEESITENKATVAWILKKRLNAWWQIWADATVCYAFKLPTKECTPKKVLEYLYEKNDYNTRQKKWLPKTPIWNPSYETIEATLNDKKTEYWYYLHDLSGKIYYWKTDAEHEANKKNFMNKK